MSLVAYASSDSEEESEEQMTPETDLIVKPPPQKQREPVKITIPSLKQFRDEDTEAEPSAKPKPKVGSGLFSLLPPPKYSGSSVETKFTPYILTKRKDNVKSINAKPALKKSPANTETKNASVSKNELFIKESEDTSVNNDNENSSAPDYFSLVSADSKIESNPVVNLESSSNSSSSLFSSLPKPTQRTNVYESSSTSYEEIVSTYESAHSDNLYDTPTASYESASAASIQSVSSSGECNWKDSYHNVDDQTSANDTSFLDDEVFKKLKGRQEMKDINIIDINAADQLTDKKEWLMRSLTEETVHRPSKRRHDMPTQQQKRKHQITYLAYQAKERELDLKNQWALNSMTRRETQAKYGF